MRSRRNAAPLLPVNPDRVMNFAAGG